MTWELFQLDLLSFRYGNAIRLDHFPPSESFLLTLATVQKIPKSSLHANTLLFIISCLFVEHSRE
jgi:hypothetical protein